jgi:hypothetical protein
MVELYLIGPDISSAHQKRRAEIPSSLHLVNLLASHMVSHLLRNPLLLLHLHCYMGCCCRLFVSWLPPEVIAYSCSLLSMVVVLVEERK